MPRCPPFETSWRLPVFGRRHPQEMRRAVGGERTRLAVARMLLRPSNLLLLDEPTNHLYLDSKDVLLDALVAYGGTLIFVWHDRYFVERLATRIIEVGGGRASRSPAPIWSSSGARNTWRKLPRRPSPEKALRPRRSRRARPRRRRRTGGRRRRRAPRRRPAMHRRTTRRASATRPTPAGWIASARHGRRACRTSKAASPRTKGRSKPSRRKWRLPGLRGSREGAVGPRTASDLDVGGRPIDAAVGNACRPGRARRRP